MKRKLVWGLGLCLSVLPLLFALRLLYGYTLDATPDATVLGLFDNNNGNGSGNSEGQFGETRKNYASWKMGREKSGGSAPTQPMQPTQPTQVDQKYEKV